MELRQMRNRGTKVGVTGIVRLKLLFPIWVLSLLVVTVITALAHDDSMPGKGRVPLHVRENMRAFAAEHHHNENLAAQSVTSCVDGLAGNFPCSNVDLMAFLPLSQIGGGNGNDIWGWTDSLTGKEYAIMGLTNGTAFVDISDAINPVYLGHLPTNPAGSTSSWRDIKTYADHAYIGSEAAGSGMQIVDLTQLRDITSPPVTITETAFYTGFSTSHNIVINEDSGFAYGAGVNNGNCARGLHFVDILNPTNPQSAGCFDTDGYTHDAQCVTYNGPDSQHAGKEICFAYNEDTLTIVDVSNKSAPVQLSRTGYANRGYSHQGWITEDQAHLLMDDELDERNISSVTNTRTLIWNIEDLDNPFHQADYTGVSTSIDHNQYIVGDYSYQANYQSGLRILDISDIANSNLSEAGFFDIYPSGNATNFNGAWSVYPFFASGNVIVSGIEQGLFILRPNITVISAPPVVNIIRPVDNDPTPLTGTVQIQISASDDLDADATLTVEWNVDGGPWQATTYSASDHIANWDSSGVIDGAHVINARAIDSDLGAGTDSSNVTSANGTLKFTIDSVSVTITTGKGNRNTGDATVTVLSDDPVPVPVANVALEGRFSGDDWSGVRSASTDNNGQADFNTPKVKNLSFVQFCVDLASKAGWELDVAGSTFCGDSNGGSAFGTVAGKVSDAATINGDGIPSAAVSTDTGQAGNTDSFGIYSIANVPVGNRTISVTASGYDGQNTVSGVFENATTTVDFSLDESVTSGFGTIRGTVFEDGSGSRLQGVTLQVVGGTSSRSNKRGKYSIQNVPAGVQTVIAILDDYVSQPQEITVVAGAKVTLDYMLVGQ